MREISFRGKRAGNGEWVYGFYTPVFGAGPIIITDAEMEDDCSVSFDFEHVTPNTVGRYTGLKDRNGKRIFEGDVIRYTFDSPDDPTATENGLKVRIGRVFWSDWRASFAVTAGNNGSSAINNDIARYVRGRSIYEYVRGANTVEVIGNIHDNPNLLEV